MGGELVSDISRIISETWVSIDWALRPPVDYKMMIRESVTRVRRSLIPPHDPSHFLHNAGLPINSRRSELWGSPALCAIPGTC